MTWIAWKMLTGNQGKYLGIILGIAFASLLIAQQSNAQTTPIHAPRHVITASLSPTHPESPKGDRSMFSGNT